MLMNTTYIVSAVEDGKINMKEKQKKDNGDSSIRWDNGGVRADKSGPPVGVVGHRCPRGNLKEPSG